MFTNNIQTFLKQLEDEGLIIPALGVHESSIRWMFKRHPLHAWAYKSISQELFDLEIDSIFLNSWLFVGLATQIPEPGDYFVWEVFQKSFLIIRGQDNRIRCFWNVCSHRGSCLAPQGAGKASFGKIECPYHGWQFDLYGQLANCRNASVSKELLNLKEIEVDVFLNNMIFINPNNAFDVPSVSEKYGWMSEKMAPYQFSDMKFLEPVFSDLVPAKWLVLLENNQESYHAIIHKEYLELFAGGIINDHFYAFASSHKNIKSSNVREYLKRVSEFENLFPHLNREQNSGWSFFYIYPNTGITVTPHEVQVDQILPVDKNSSEIRSYRFGLTDSRDSIQHLRKLSGLIDDNVKKEDLALFPKIQIGLNSAPNGQKFLLVDQENGVAQLLDYLARLAPILALENPPLHGQLSSTNCRLQSLLAVHDQLLPATYIARRLHT